MQHQTVSTFELTAYRIIGLQTAWLLTSVGEAAESGMAQTNTSVLQTSRYPWGYSLVVNAWFGA